MGKVMKVESERKEVERKINLKGMYDNVEIE